MLTKQIRREYTRMRREGFAARVALSYSQTVARWDALERRGLVGLTREPDDDPSSALDMDYEDSAQGRAWREKLRQRASEDGVWGIQGWYRFGTDQEWERGDAVWGFVGDDDGGGYQYDIMAETIGELRSTLDRVARSVPHILELIDRGYLLSED